jgi:prophage antirepressor-like protein
MNDLTTFAYGVKPVRVLDRDGQPWWVLKDVCDVLTIGNSRDAANRLDDDEKGVGQIDTLGGKQEMTIISESGLYSVILRSDKPEARRFRKWVTAEVLPSIRRTGGYIPTAPGESDSEIMSRALVIANRTLAERERRIAALAAENEDLEAALNTSLEYWTVMKYNTETGRKWTMAQCQSIGRRLSAYCRTNGYEIKSCLTGDDRFSSVNSYPLTAWEAFMERAAV